MSIVYISVPSPWPNLKSMPRRISRKRARYLRRRGETVRWNVASNFRYWEMPLEKFGWYRSAKEQRR
jgi:hypothetical protein